MAEDVQRLMLQIDASATLLRQELAQAARNIDGFASGVEGKLGRVDKSFLKMSNVAGAAMKGFGALGGILAGVSFVELARGALQFADDLDAASTQAGIAIERYQTLKEGLRSLEVGGEQADKIFSKLYATLGDVQAGTAGKGITEAFDRMGITAKIANGEIDTTDELLDAIAAAASRYTTEAQYVADVTALVGQKMGPQLAAALKDGGAALHTQEQAFRDAGAVITDEYIAKLADANEAIDAWTTRTKSTFTIYAAEVIGIFQRLGVVIDNVTGRIDTSTRSGLITKGMMLRQEIDDLQSGKGNFGIPAVGEASRKQAELDDVNKQLRAQEVRNPGLTDPMTRLFPMGGSWYGNTPKVSPKSTKTSAAKAAKRPEDDPFATRARRGDFDVPISDPVEAFLQAQMPIAQIKTDMADIETSVLGISSVKLISAESVALADQFAENLSSGLSQAIINGQSLGSALVNSIKAAAAELVASGLLNLLSGGKRGTSFGEALGGIASLFGGFRETGGGVMPGKAYVVGEKRPELFVPSTAGYIMPRVPSGQGGGGQQQSVTVTVNPSPLFVTTVAQGAQAAAQETLRKSSRQRMPMSAGV